MLHGYKYRVETDLLKGKIPYRFYTNANDVRKFVLSLEMTEYNYWIITDKNGSTIAEKDLGGVRYYATNIPKALKDLY